MVTVDWVNCHFFTALAGNQVRLVVGLQVYKKT